MAEERAREPKATAEGNTVTGPLTACALLRGETRISMRHRLKELHGTAWGKVAEALSGSNGKGADRLIAALKGLRLAGHNEEETRRYILAAIAKSDTLVEAWLECDPVLERRRKAPVRTVEDVAAMFDSTTWLWEPWIPRGYLSMIAGRPGVGKSYIAAWLAAQAVSAGGRFPDGTLFSNPDGCIMWIDTEGTHRLLIERLKTMTAPAARFLWPLDPKNLEEDFPLVNLADPRWVGIVADIAMSRRPTWIIVDSLRGAHKLDENSSDMQTLLGTAAALARDLDCAFSFVHHLRKASQWEKLNEITLDQMRGSTAIAAMGRVVLAIDKPDPLKTELRMRVLKSNLAKFPEPVGIDIGPNGPYTVAEAPEAPLKGTAADTCMEWLRVKLEAGPHQAGELLDEARARGMSRRSMFTAREKLHLVVAKVGGHWEWSLPIRPGQEEPPW